MYVLSTTSYFPQPLHDACLAAAAGWQYGLKYAINTPGLMGCSGAVAAISGYKAFLEPWGLPPSIPVPLPLILSTLIYCCLFIREQVSNEQWNNADTRGTMPIMNGAMMLAACHVVV
jgi:hypothetical protein